MDFVGVAVIFIVSWWIAFLAVLPIGVKGQFEDDGEVAEGTEEGAPKEPMLRKKAIWASFGALGVTVLVFLLVVPYLKAG